jgi:hypothetical protein
LPKLQKMQNLCNKASQESFHLDLSYPYVKYFL